MDYYAHKTKDNRTQTIIEHSKNVSDMAKDFSIDMFKSICSIVGMAHDIGKYSQKFQNRLNGKKVRFGHSICGAIEYDKLTIDKDDTNYPTQYYKRWILPIIKYCIACHHTGLQDGMDVERRLIESDIYTGSNDYSIYKKDIQLNVPHEKDISDMMQSISKKYSSCENSKEIVELYAFFIRYVFSCLTDADFLDTERFCNPSIERSNFKSDFKTALKKVDDKLSSFKLDNELKLARNRLQLQAFENAKNPSDINILNMPTGSGKTLCSLKIALEKALQFNKKRIIYVIPYTSIIEQTAKTFEDIIGNDIDILQHHSNYIYELNKTNDDDDDSISKQEKLKLACENWDAPFIITTTVQFFESLYHYKSSKLRKLHNLQDAIIIFDEIHMLPIDCLKPCLKAIDYITEYLNSEVIFLSATMPNYNLLFNRYISKESKITNLIVDKQDFPYFETCKYINLDSLDLESLILKAKEYSSSLIIVNKKKTAKKLYDEFPKDNGKKKYHLSTYMTPIDRSKTIESIRQDLSNGQDIVVISTSLVEAGVDFDFKAVFRELAGLDNILQSGGRCNRDGLASNGDTYIFQLNDRPPRSLTSRINITNRLLKQYDNISSTECIQDYYNNIFKFNDDEIDSNSISKDIDGYDFMSIPFETYAKEFQFIKEDTISVIINDKRNNDCDNLLNQLLDINSDRKAIMRKLQKYSVNLKFYEFEEIHNILEDFNNLGLLVLTDTDGKYYSSKTGININYIEEDIII